jgi:creatinine amidohydrolase/Fe(II)-dependent formamide hydrolase-like protein
MMHKPWVDFDALQKQTDLVILPTGAVELYGQHLPVGTDTIVVTHVARKVVERIGAPVSGVVGNPEVATPEKGAEAVRRGVDRIVEFVRQEFGG